MLNATTESYASARDINPVSREVNFYGVLMDIIELHYSKDNKFVLFKCDWVDNSRGLIEQDDFGFTLVNFNHLLYPRHQKTDEPFILASQAKQVFFVQDLLDKDWHIVIKTKPRDFFDVFGQQLTSESTMNDETEAWTDQCLDDATLTTGDDVSWVRQGVIGSLVDKETRDHMHEDD